MKEYNGADWPQWSCMNESVNPRHKILVVDDDVDLNTAFALMLEFDGHEVRTTRTCEAALLLLEKIHFDLIIAEYYLPEMKGDEMAAIVKQARPDQPIILMTSNVESLHPEEHPILGVDCLLNKPFTISQLREAVIWALDLHTKKQPTSQISPKVQFGQHEASGGTRKSPKRHDHR